MTSHSPSRVTLGRWAAPSRRSALVEAPLALEVGLIGWWILARLAPTPDLMGALLVAGSLAALRWPGTGTALAGLAFLFPSTNASTAEGSALIAAAALGCLIGATKSGARMQIHVAVLAAAALAVTTGLALLRLPTGLESPTADAAIGRWAGLVLGLAVIPILLYVLGAGGRRVLVVGGVAVTVAVVVGGIDGLWPGALDATPLGPLLSGVASDRASGPFPSPNRLGTVAAVYALTAAVLVWEQRGRWGILLGLAATGALVTVLASFSRGALVGLVLAGIVLIARRSMRLGAATALLVVVAAAVAAPVFMDARLGSPPVSSGRPAEQATNDDDRLSAWKAGVRMGLERPLTGFGYGSFAVVGRDYGGPDTLRTAHNETISLFAESGLPGAFSFVGLMVAGAWSLRRRGWVQDIGLAALIVFAVASSFNVQSVYPQVTVVIWSFIAASLALAHGRDVAREGPFDAD